jgi:hemerythrin-like metal-binding protein
MMALIEWRDDFRLGIASVDHEHEEMIRLINEAHARLEADAPAREIEEFLGEVYAQIAAHFALEESVMRNRGYDEYDAHKADHERLLDGIREIMDSFEAGDYDGLSEELSLRLRDWFVDHFKTKDSRLHKKLGVF